MTRRTVLFQWDVGLASGWGMVGLQLMARWAGRPDLLALPSVPFDPDALVADPERSAEIVPLLEAARALWDGLRATGGGTACSPGMVLHGIGNHMISRTRSAGGVYLTGTPTIGLPFPELNRYDDASREAARRYAALFTGCRWARTMLEAAGFPVAGVWHQGVDTARFHPAPPPPDLLPGRFVVYSGGKLEPRKGQDLVIRAFRAFAARHRDAVLLTSWQSPWPALALSMNQHAPDLAPLALGADGQPDLHGWTTANGIAPDQVAHLPMQPNPLLPPILRRADAALFPNRAEAGTNLVAMECMACGVPTILSANTGHLDLLAPGANVPLHSQTELPDESLLGWGESSVDEMVAALERVYDHPAEARMIGATGATAMRDRDWTRSTDRLAELVLPFTV